MIEYIVDECADNVGSLQDMLDEMSERGWRVVSTMWLPRRRIANLDGEFDANAQYSVVFEREVVTDADRI